MNSTGTLYFFCGKMASGKSTLAAQIAAEKDALLLSEDRFLAELYPHEITDVPAYIERARRVGATVKPIVEALLRRGLSVVMDFPANTPAQRAWFREMIESTDAHHELHHIVCGDDLCKQQLAQRARDNPERRATDTVEMFEAINKYYQPVKDDEQFAVMVHNQ
jgi:predicted kinase